MSSKHTVEASFYQLKFISYNVTATSSQSNILTNFEFLFSMIPQHTVGTMFYQIKYTLFNGTKTYGRSNILPNKRQRKRQIELQSHAWRGMDILGDAWHCTT